MIQTDLIIIGSGPGGYEAAAFAAKHGLQVVIAEEAFAGGTCLNCGCIPTKALIHDAEKAVAAPNEGAMRLAAAIDRKNQVIDGLRKGIEALLGQPSITFLHGHASLVDANTVAVGEETVKAKDILIATGSKAKMPPVSGLSPDEIRANPRVVTSEELLNLSTPPQHLCIVGAGVIGLEMASVFRAFGSKVTIIEFMKECLPTMDQELARRLRKSMEKQGIVFNLGCGLQQVDGDKVTYQNVKKGTSETIEADCILVATGRQANVEGLGLENTSIEVGRRGIEVDDNMQTTVPHIYAIGDVNGRQMLAHAATFQGFHAINHILGKTDNIRLNIMPAAVFTHPEIASVGLTEDKCKEMGIACAVRKSLYRANGRAQASEATDGLLKLVCDDQGKLIGCHALGQEASWMVQEVATLMNFDATADRLAEIVHIHPTLSEILLNAASH
ncbi:dihydrolipoyl dehydrogenase [Hallella sp.]|uniref:dihydrolipoyl dehydrogenase n=1 Tax=Hallella sp. TaxID=2980186 RepID=UPI00307B09CA